MRVYWKEVRKGWRLILTDGDTAEEIGGIRETPRGYDAFAKTFGYEPGRAAKGIASMEEAREFVEQFSPWEMYGAGQNLSVEPEIVPQDVQEQS